MRTVFVYLLFVLLATLNGSAQDVTAGAHTKGMAAEQSTASLDATLAPSSILIVGGGLLVIGAILRRNLRT